MDIKNSRSSVGAVGVLDVGQPTGRRYVQTIAKGAAFMRAATAARNGLRIS